jgi:N-acetylneuraminic acid mutarotase
MKNRGLVPFVSLLLALGPTGSTAFSRQRVLTFEERVAAQAAIEAVYAAGRSGKSGPAPGAVSRDLLERKVRTYLAKSAALEAAWNAPITAAALRRELERIAADTKMPDRLQAIYDALGRDSVLIQETFVRAELAERLVSAVAPDWETSWRDRSARFDPMQVRVTAEALPGLPSPGDTVHGDSAIGPAAPSCGFQDLWITGGTSGAPALRTAPTAVWTGAEMIVWGGTDNSSAALATGGRYDPVLDRWLPMTGNGAPAARADHTAVWTGSVMIVWGGDTPGTTFNTGGRYDPVANTWTPTTLTGAPVARSHHGAVWTGSEMIVWGGTGGGSTGGRYNPSTDTWTATTLAGAPGARSDFSTVWTGTEMIVWGGGGALYNPASDTWRAMSGIGAPGTGTLPATVWTGKEMIVWGGAFVGFTPGGGRYNPATNTWVPTTQIGAPANRYQAAATWTGNRMVVWGGIDFSHGAPNDRVNTGATYDPAADTWTPTTLTGAPAPAAHLPAVWSGSRMIVWGSGAAARYDPVSDAWSPVTMTSPMPGPRAGHTAVWTGSEMIVWGGYDNTGGRYDPLLDAWLATPLLNAPSVRQYHTAVWTGGTMIVWGGQNPFSFGKLGDGASFDPVANAWTPLPATGAPTARSNHSAIWDGHRMVVWGGGSNTGGIYDPIQNSWTATSTVGAPSARTNQTAIWTGSSMIVWGGGTSVTYLNTGARFDPVANSWTPTSTIGAPTARVAHTAVWTGQNMIIWGGYPMGPAGPNGASYDPLLDQWSALPDPPGSLDSTLGWYYHTAVWTGHEMIVYGGEIPNDYAQYTTTSSAGARYDPATGAWTPTTTLNSPG